MLHFVVLLYCYCSHSIRPRCGSCMSVCLLYWLLNLICYILLFYSYCAWCGSGSDMDF